MTAVVIGCSRCVLRDIVSRNALCGSGMVWVGDHATIERSAFVDNGDSASRLWADGLTAIYVPDSQIRENRFMNNSDIGLIVGYGVRSRIEDNRVIQRTQSAFAGVMLDNFNSNDITRHGDFREAIVARNTIDCGLHRCVFGVQVGPHPWYPARNIVGGVITDNDIYGAKVGINVDGAGIAAAPVSIFNNRVTDPASGYFVECDRPITAAWMNIAPTSIVNRAKELDATGHQLADWCQLWSPVGQLEAPDVR